jgi:hypothetical protein
VRDTGSNDYWTLCKMSGGLPHETSRYVPKVLAIAIIMNNLDRFSLADEHVDAPLDTADLEVPAGASIPLVARAAGTSVQHLRELNPEMLSDVVPSRGRDFVMHIPAAGLARARGILRRLLDRHERDGLELEVSRLFDWGKDELPAGAKGGEADPSGPADHILYRVGDHETLEEVSRTFGSSPAEIVETNHLDADAKLLRGMLLSVRVRDDVMARIGRKRAAARLNFTDVAPSAAAGSSGTKGSASLEHGTQGNAPLASASRDNDVSMGRQRTRKR